MYRHVGQLVIISDRFTELNNRHVGISTYFINIQCVSAQIAVIGIILISIS